MKKILLCLIILNVALAESQIANGESQISEGVKTLRNLLPFVTLIILSTFIFSVFIYALGRFVNLGSVKSWAKDQVYESFLSLFIGLLVIFILETFYLDEKNGNSYLNLNIVSLLRNANLLPDACKEKNDLFDIAECEVTQFIQSIGILMTYIFSSNMIFSIFSNCKLNWKGGIEIGIANLETKFSWNPLAAAMTDLSDFLTLGYNLLLVAYILNSFQIYLVEVAPYLFLLFFPAGVVLRSFSLTRKVGGSIIAISIGISLLYPLLVAIGYGYVINLPGFRKIILFNTDKLINLINLLLVAIFSFPLTPALAALAPLVVGYAFLQPVWGVASAILFGNVETIAPIVLGLLVIPYIIFDVLENFIGGLSSIIGERVSVIGWMGRVL